MSLYHDLIEYTDKQYTPLHMPGHKRNPLFPQPDAYKSDITEISGFDSLYEESGPLLVLKGRVQRLYHSENSFLLVNGSTGGLLTAIRSATRRGDTVLMARNCHCAVYHAIRMFGLHAEYIQPDYDKYGIAEGIRLEQVQKALERCNLPESDSGAQRATLVPACTRPSLVILTSPTYEGRISELKAIAAYLHEQNIPLLVDEAHGAHLSLHPAFEGSAVAAGADLVIQSLHKTLPALTQTALLHVNGSLISLDRVRTNYKMLQTSSPSFLLLSSVDQCISALEERADELYATLKNNLIQFYKKTKELKQLHVIVPAEYANFCSSAQFSVCPSSQLSNTFCDPSRLVVTTPPILSGLQLAKRLKKDFGIELEASAPRHIIAITGIADTAETFERFTGALLAIDAELERQQVSTDNTSASFNSDLQTTTPSAKNQALEASRFFADNYFRYPTIPKAVYDSYAVEDAPTEALPYSSCEGRISVEFLYLYPPGIPMLVPGERISAELLDCIDRLLKNNFSLYGPKRAADKYLQVIREN